MALVTTLLRSRAAAALASPHGVDHYLEQLNPMWAAHDVRAHVVAVHRETDTPGVPARRYPEIAVEVREICERYGLAYNTGSLGKQLFSVASKICRMALPTRKTSQEAAPVAEPAVAA